MIYIIWILETCGLFDASKKSPNKFKLQWTHASSWWVEKLLWNSASIRDSWRNRSKNYFEYHDWVSIMVQWRIIAIFSVSLELHITITQSIILWFKQLYIMISILVKCWILLDVVLCLYTMHNVCCLWINISFLLVLNLFY